jgi:putative transposase
VFDGLVRDGAFSFDADAAVDWATERRRDAEAILQKASSQDLKVATIRLERLQPYLQDTTRGTPSSRTLRRYLAQYRFAESTCGVGFVGLIPGWRRSGNRVPRLLQAVLDEVTKVAKEHFTTEKGLSFKRVHERVTTACEEHSLPIPSYAWTAKFLKRLPAYATKRAREGSKAAYSLQERMPIASSEPVGLPRPLRRVHVDHTEIDVETIFAETGESLGRAWLTIGICEDTRRVVGLVLTYEPPSYRAVLLFLRDMIRRFGRLPDTLVVDGGKEFRSIWVEAFAATNHMRIERRPPAKPRFGSQIERYFGTLNQMLIHCLAGHTKLRKNVRQMTSSVDPSRSAVWTLCELSRLIEQFIFEVYDELPHRATLMTPKQAFAIGLRTHGSRPMRHIAYDEAFLFSTMPSTRKGTAKVQVDGVKINYLYYTSPALYRHFGQVVEIRYDPFDLSRAFALLDGQWQQVRTRHIGIFEGRSEGELQTLVDEWRQRRRWVEKERLTETKLARFLEEIEHTESLLKARRRAAEDRQARRLAEGADTVDAADAGDERVGAPMVQPQPSDPGNADPFGGLNDQSLDIKCEEAN